MRNLRKVLALALALCLCAGIFMAGDIVEAASTKVNLSAHTLAAGKTVRWYPSSNTSGHSLTNGGEQIMKFYMGALGNKIEIGFMQYATKTNYKWYSGTVNSLTTGEKSKILTGPTAYYQPYLKNNNATVSIDVQATSYIKIN